MIELKIDYPFLKVLPYYSFENLIYHPDNLEEYYQKLGNNDFSKNDYTASILAEKEKNREYIIFGIGQARSGYPFYKENQKDKKLKDFQENSRSIIDILRSSEFEVFYKVFPMKDYAKQIPARHNAKPNDLAKTKWFRKKIEEAMQ